MIPLVTYPSGGTSTCHTTSHCQVYRQNYQIRILTAISWLRPIVRVSLNWVIRLWMNWSKWDYCTARSSDNLMAHIVDFLDHLQWNCYQGGSCVWCVVAPEGLGHGLHSLSPGWCPNACRNIQHNQSLKLLKPMSDVWVNSSDHGW